MWRRRLVLLNGPCAVQKNVGGGVDNGLSALFVPPLMSRMSFHDFRTCYKHFSAGLPGLADHMYSRAQAV